MAKDDYTTPGGGLKLKGSGITKKKKKKMKPASNPASDPSAAKHLNTKDTPDSPRVDDAQDDQRDSDNTKTQRESRTNTKSPSKEHPNREAHPNEEEEEDPEQEQEQDKYQGKTAAQLSHDAARRRRLDERLRREGGRTHKQRVEELNRYLSGLSEHHDMPRIGPG